MHVEKGFTENLTRQTAVGWELLDDIRESRISPEWV